MWNRIVFCCLFFVLVCAGIGDDEDKCLEVNCYGEEYECIDGTCYCAKGYIPNHFQNKCLRCPGLGEKCLGPCCNVYGNGSLQCWQGICQPCYDNLGKWTCRFAYTFISRILEMKRILRERKGFTPDLSNACALCSDRNFSEARKYLHV